MKSGTTKGRPPVETKSASDMASPQPSRKVTLTVLRAVAAGVAVAAVTAMVLAWTTLPAASAPLIGFAFVTPTLLVRSRQRG